MKLTSKRFLDIVLGLSIRVGPSTSDSPCESTTPLDSWIVDGNAVAWKSETSGVNGCELLPSRSYFHSSLLPCAAPVVPPLLLLLPMTLRFLDSLSFRCNAPLLFFFCFLAVMTPVLLSFLLSAIEADFAVASCIEEPAVLSRVSCDKWFRLEYCEG